LIVFPLFEAEKAGSVVRKMDTSSMSEVGKLLHATYTVQSNDERKHCEEQLKTLAGRPQEFFGALCGILLDTNGMFDESVKQSAATNLKNFVGAGV
jgi:hypothetical protein